MIELLGAPYLEYGRDDAPADYYVSGYRRQERPIEGRVLIYIGADMVLYVWLDAAGFVSDTFVGVS